jgi:signal transduction histidine kinase
VSLVALHAGGLEVRPDLSPDSVRETARLIRGTARQALEELRDVIGVLRDPTGSAGDGRGGDTRGGRPAGAGTAIGTEEVPSAPQPTLRDVPRLVEESRQAGMHVELSMLVEEVDEAPGPLGRDTYRIVREALTNVGKHARGTATTVSVSGRPGDGLRVVVRNRLPHRPPVAPLPGSGVGLVGLTERVAIAGGTLTHGPNADGDFVVDAELRWAQ